MRVGYLRALWQTFFLRKGWIEQQRQGPKNEVHFRLTEKGLEAKKSRVPSGRAGSKAKAK